MLDNVLKEIDELKNQKHALIKERKKLIEKVKQENSNITKNYEEIEKLKNKRQEINADVSENKQARTYFLEQTTQILNSIKNIRRELKNIGTNPGIPQDILKQIEQLEWKHQTEIISLEGESKINSIIKSLKTELNESKQKQSVINKLETMQEELGALKKEADTHHKEVIDLAKNSEDIHKSMIAVIKQTKELKEKRNHTSELIDGNSNNLDNLSNLIKEKTLLSRELRKQIIQERQDDKRKKIDMERKMLSDKLSLVKQKLERKEKLTTEDLLILSTENDD